MNLTIHIDGGSRGNPGPAAAGVVIQEQGASNPLHEAGYCLGTMTNNKAEYRGLLIALETAAKLHADRVDIYSDSQLMVQQIVGRYRVKSPGLVPLYRRATDLLSQFGQWRITHVRRENNQRADELANMAMDAGHDVIVTAAPAPPQGHATTPPSGTPAPPDTVAVQQAPPPRWTAQLTADPGDRCPARCRADQAFPFGATTPAGCCVFLAKTVLDTDLFSPAAPADTRQALCLHCGIAINIQPA